MWIETLKMLFLWRKKNIFNYKKFSWQIHWHLKKLVNHNGKIQFKTQVIHYYLHCKFPKNLGSLIKIPKF